MTNTQIHIVQAIAAFVILMGEGFTVIVVATILKLDITMRLMALLVCYELIGMVGRYLKRKTWDRNSK